MTERVTGDFLSLLIAVQESPFATHEELATRTKSSKPTVAKRLRALQEQRMFVVRPVLDSSPLGLEMADVLLEANGHEGVLKLEKLGEKHPYTSYRGRCYGSVNGMYMQFRIPIGAKPQLVEFLKRLKKEEIILHYDILPTDEESTIYTSMRIDGWNADSMTWTFDWKKWFNKKIILKEKKTRDKKPGECLEWFTQKDAYIISELTRGARRKNTDLISALKKRGADITQQTFSRRYQMIRDECFKGFKVIFKSTAFDIYNTVLLYGKTNGDYLKLLRAKLKKAPIPFESTMRSSENNLFWQVRLQPSHLSPLISNIHANLDTMKLCLIDYMHTRVYYLWPDTFDDEIQGWRTDKAFMVDSVFE